MKNVLLLTDFTNKSKNAHNYALSLLQGQQCTFHLFSIQKVWEYTMDDLMAANAKDDLDNALLGDNRTKLGQTITQLKKQFPSENFSFNSSVDYDVFTNAINEAIDTYSIDLIVCGTNGKSGLLEVIFSSHALRIIRKVDCPVLIIPENAPYEDPIGIQYLLDYNDLFERCGKEPLLEIVRKYKSQINVIRLTFGYDMEPLDCKEEHKEIARFFPTSKVTYATHIDEDPIAVIKECSMAKPVQMQVLSAHNESFLERIFSNSHLSRIVNSATIPLLILRDCNQ
jgi:nucleotide-binding universal stress UspA family protein